MPEIPAVHNYSSILPDTNVIMNLIRSDPTGYSLNYLNINGSTTYITTTVEAELERNLPGQLYATYLTWAYNAQANGDVLLLSSSVPPGRNAGEQSIALAISQGHVDGPHLVLSGDGGAEFGSAHTLNSIEFTNSLLLSGEINYATYGVLLAQIGSVAPHELVGRDGQLAALVPGQSYDVNGNIIEVRAAGLIVNGQHVGYLQTFEVDPSTGIVSLYGHANCFAQGTLIALWSQDFSSKTKDSDAAHMVEHCDFLHKKSIEKIIVGDFVASFDASGKIKPGKVVRVFSGKSKIILDFFGTFVTPGHFYLRGCAAEHFRFDPLIDILREDGVIEAADGRRIRAATGLEVDDVRDGFVWAIAGATTPDGSGICVREKGQLRLGTRLITQDGRDFCIADLIEIAGGVVTDEGLIRIGDVEMPFHWSFGEQLPNPEDYILQRSGTTLAEIYKAAEWEGRRPSLPAPLVMSGGPVQPLSQSEVAAMPRNMPLALRGGAYAVAKRPILADQSTGGTGTAPRKLTEEDRGKLH